MEGMHDILRTVCEQDVLAIIVHVDGSAYRREGACMLFREDGMQLGVLSAGCLESDIAARVGELKKKEASETIVFDMRAEDDLSWGQGAGCNGTVHVLLEVVDARLHHHLRTVTSYLNEGTAVTMVKKLSNGEVSDYVFLADTHLFGEWKGDVPEQVKEQLMNRQNEESGLRFFSELSAHVYVHTIFPKPRVIIFGAGADAVPLARLAAQSGFSVVVSDWRPALCNTAYFPDADELIVAFPTEAISRLHLTSDDFILILTHQFQYDQQILQLLLTQSVRYIGVLGSQLRTKRLLGGDIPPVVKSPVGLSIGAEGPEEIAISILAELILLQRSSRRKGAMHV